MIFNLSVTALGGGIFDVTGRRVALSKRFKQKANDYTSVWKKSQVAMQQNVVDVWNAGQSAWMPLRPDYVEWKRKQGWSTAKNIRTGDMRSAMQYGQVNEMQPQAWSWGIDAMDSKWYETTIEPYPALANAKRPFVALTKRFIDTVQDNMKNYMAKLFKNKA